jgi:hypothetical protein
MKHIKIGTPFGKWTVIGDGVLTSQNAAYYFPCRCKCGDEKLLNSAALRSGQTKGCKSCAAFERRAKRDENLIGKQFGKWTVIGRIPPEKRKFGGVYNTWICECKCGNVLEMSAYQVRNGTGTGCDKCYDRKKPQHRLRPYESCFNVGRTGAKTRSITWALTYDEFLDVITKANSQCHYCHAPVTWAEYGSVRNNHHLDRMDNDLGYLPGNVVAACKRCNFQKSSYFTYAQWYAMTECYRNGTMAA